MTKDQIFNILDRQQALIAEEGITKAQKAKKTLSKREKCNMYAIIGGVLRFKDIAFVHIDGGGLLIKANGSWAWGCTLEDMEREIYKTYHKRVNWN